MSVRSFLSHDC